MRFDLKSPCKNCPFRNDETRIVFSCRERAMEIEDQAYRRGFPCHLSAKLVEEEDDPLRGGGYCAAENSQHCVGFIIMKIKEGEEESWPGVDNDEELVDRLRGRVNLNAPVFSDTEEFFKANQGADHENKARYTDRRG